MFRCTGAGQPLTRKTPEIPENFSLESPWTLYHKVLYFKLAKAAYSKKYPKTVAIMHSSETAMFCGCVKHEHVYIAEN